MNLPTRLSRAQGLQATREIKGLLFDKDGTLIDLNRSWLRPIQACVKLLEKAHNQPGLSQKLMRAGGWDENQQCWLKDSIIAFDTSEALLTCWARVIGAPITDQQHRQINQIVADALSDAVPVIDDIQTFSARWAKTHTLGVASMDDELNVRQTLAGLQIASHYSFVCGADSGFGRKPETGMIDAFAQNHTLAPQQIAVIGDSPKDLVMARKAGALSIGVLSGGCTAQQLKPYADAIVEDIGQLDQLLE